MRNITPDSEKVAKKQHSFYKLFSAIISLAVSLFTAAFSFYLVSRGIYWFIAIGTYFCLEALFILLPLLIKDDYQAMRTQGVFQIVGVIVFMSYLLFMILWNDAKGLMPYTVYTYVILGVALAIKCILSLISGILIRISYNPILHAYRNNDLISAFYFVLIIALVISNQFFPGNSVALFDNLLREKPFWIYIINIGLNAGLTTLAALLALSTDIRSKTKENLSTIGKIKHTVRWFSNNEVSMFFGLIFTTYLAILAIINMRMSPFYILLVFYYVGTAFIRLNNYTLHKMIQKETKGNAYRENRLSSWILLLDALFFLFFSNVLILGAVFLMIQRVNTGTNLYLFLFYIIPMAIWRFIASNSSVKKNRKGNKTYQLGLSLMGIIFSFMSLLEIVAIAAHNIPIVWLRYVIIILVIAIVKVAVIVVAVIFTIHWIRSMILNSRRKEKRAQRMALEQKENKDKGDN